MKKLLLVLFIFLSFAAPAQQVLHFGKNVVAAAAPSLSPLTNFAPLTGITAVSNTFTNTSGGANARMVTVNAIPAASVFIIQMNASVTENSGFLAVSTNSSGDPRFSCIVLVEWMFNTSTSGRWASEYSGTGYDAFSNTTFSTPIPLVRLRGDGSFIYAEMSFDNGGTWTVLPGSPPASITQPNALLYVQGEFNSNSGTNGDTMRNILSNPAIP